jgi:hypothetical protein
VPRQKIYEVLDSLIDKGFADVVQERTKLFSAIEPDLASPNYIERRGLALQRELQDQGRMGHALIEDLRHAYSQGQDGRGALSLLRVVNNAGQVAAHLARLQAETEHEYLELATAPRLDSPGYLPLSARGVHCRILQDPEIPAAESLPHVEVRQIAQLPMRMVLCDGRAGLIALLDPVVTAPSGAAVIFQHPGMGEAMRALFEDYWRKAAFRSESLRNEEVTLMGSAGSTFQ